MHQARVDSQPSDLAGDRSQMIYTHWTWVGRIRNGNETNDETMARRDDMFVLVYLVMTPVTVKRSTTE